MKKFIFFFVILFLFSQIGLAWEGDSLGNHTARRQLQMGSYDITTSSGVSGLKEIRWDDGTIQKSSPPVDGGWVGTATSNLNMAGYNITAGEEVILSTISTSLTKILISTNVDVKSSADEHTNLKICGGGAAKYGLLQVSYGNTVDGTNRLELYNDNSYSYVRSYGISLSLLSGDSFIDITTLSDSNTLIRTKGGGAAKYGSFKYFYGNTFAGSSYGEIYHNNTDAKFDVNVGSAVFNTRVEAISFEGDGSALTGTGNKNARILLHPGGAAFANNTRAASSNKDQYIALPSTGVSWGIKFEEDGISEAEFTNVMPKEWNGNAPILYINCFSTATSNGNMVFISSAAAGIRPISGWEIDYSTATAAHATAYNGRVATMTLTGFNTAINPGDFFHIKIIVNNAGLHTNTGNVYYAMGEIWYVKD